MGFVDIILDLLGKTMIQDCHRSESTNICIQSYHPRMINFDTKTPKIHCIVAFLQVFLKGCIAEYSCIFHINWHGTPAVYESDFDTQEFRFSIQIFWQTAARDTCYETVIHLLVL